MSGNGKSPPSNDPSDPSGPQSSPEEPVEIETDEGQGAGPAVGTAAVAAPADPLAAAQARLAELEKEKKDTYDRLLRTAADFENYKKRSRREAGEADERGRVAVLKELLPAIDNLERAVAHEGGSSGAVVEGVRLVLRQIHSILERFDVRPFDSAGKVFDPALHEAVSQLETSETPAGTIVSEFQKGYTIGPKLLRPAMVVVAKPRSSESADAESAVAGGPDEPEGL